MAESKNMELNDDAMAKAAGGAGKSQDYDMFGFIVNKLPTEQYANHYNVKGDNDEIFVCWYAGDDILSPGTEVGMTHIPQDNGWKCEPIMHI